MSAKSTLDTRCGGSKHFFLLILLTFFLATGYQATVQADNLIGGTISLPAGDAAPAGGLLVPVASFDTINGYRYWFDLYIPEGEVSATYSITVPSDASFQWLVYYDCWGLPCQSSYVTAGFYATSGTTWDSSAATLLAGGSDHSGIDLTLLTGDQISGSVSLPGGVVAPAGGLWVSLALLDTINGYQYFPGFYILEGEVSATYSITVPSDASSQWLVYYYVGASVSYIDVGYYQAGGTTWDSSAATLLAGGSDHSEINLVIMKDIIDSCALADETISGPETYDDDFYCSAENSIAAGGALGAPSPVIVVNGGYVVYSAPIIKLMPGFYVNSGFFRAGNSIK